MVDVHTHGSYFRGKKIWVSGPVGINREYCMKEMRLQVGLEECTGSSQAKAPVLHSHYLGERCMTEGGLTESTPLSSPIFCPAIAVPTTLNSLCPPIVLSLLQFLHISS